MPLVPFKSNAVPKHAYDPFQSFRDEFDRLFDHLLPTLPATQDASAVMDFRVDVSENDKEIFVKSELAGVDEKDIDVQLTRDILTIRGEKRLEAGQKEGNYHLVECRYGSFARSLRLPFEPSSAAIKASFKNGVLTVCVPKPEKPKSESVKISIRTE